MWTIMAAGEAPFTLTEEGRLRPVLPEWLFTRQEKAAGLQTDAGRVEVPVARDSFSFRFLGKAVVVYHNPERKDTFGPGGVGVVAYDLVYYDGRAKRVEGGALEGPVVLDVREGRVEAHRRAALRCSRRGRRNTCFGYGGRD